MTQAQDHRRELSSWEDHKFTRCRTENLRTNTRLRLVNTNSLSATWNSLGGGGVASVTYLRKHRHSLITFDKSLNLPDSALERSDKQWANNLLYLALFTITDLATWHRQYLRRVTSCWAHFIAGICRCMINLRNERHPCMERRSPCGDIEMSNKLYSMSSCWNTRV